MTEDRFLLQTLLGKMNMLRPVANAVSEKLWKTDRGLAFKLLEKIDYIWLSNWTDAYE